MTGDSDNPIVDYERHVATLEKIITAMEGGELSLEEGLRQYEQGITLIRQCQKALDIAEQKVRVLSENAYEEEVLVPFDEADGDDRD